jgi:RHS repeat-associated protein
MTRPWRGPAVAALLLLLPGLGIAGAQELSTTTTRYAYNADGALTQLVEQVDDNAPTTTYLTWDNFVPNAGDPTTGTVLPANGNLVAVGPEPGADAASRSFAFDAEDRLTRYADANGSVRYGFHPTWLMASSTLDGADTRYFYFDDAETPQMTNIEDGDSGLMCSEMGPVRSLSDGGLQVLLSPRKDVAGVYDPAQGTFSPYHYDAFGNEGTSSPAPATYDLYDNPHRYAGEYKDPTWGGYYLRARWYDPKLHTFLSRDPVANLNRYNYADGNPVSRVDPDGRKAVTFGTKPVRWNAAAKWVDKQSKAGHVWSRIFLAPVIGPLGLIADPAGFFHQQLHSAGGFKGWVTLGAVALEIGADAFTPELGYQSFAFRLLTDVAVGDMTSTANAISHGGSKFSWRSFAQGMEYTAGGMFYTRVLAARGYRPFNLTLEDTDKLLPTSRREVSVFRVKRPLKEGVFGWAGRKIGTAGPVGDLLNLSWQHESLIAIAKDGQACLSEVTEDGIVHLNLKKAQIGEHLTKEAKLRYIGKMNLGEARTQFSTLNPLNVKAATIEVQLGRARLNLNKFRGDGELEYTFGKRNCQAHVSQMLGMLNTTK